MQTCARPPRRPRCRSLPKPCRARRRDTGRGRPCSSQAPRPCPEPLRPRSPKLVNLRRPTSISARRAFAAAAREGFRPTHLHHLGHRQRGPAAGELSSGGPDVDASHVFADPQLAAAARHRGHASASAGRAQRALALATRWTMHAALVKSIKTRGIITRMRIFLFKKNPVSQTDPLKTPPSPDLSQSETSL